MDKSFTLADRAKLYEKAQEQQLLRRVPTFLRLDGKNFHSFTKGMERPFDERLIKCMQITTQKLLTNIEGCYFGYTQSDEITLLLIDYKGLNTQPWFNYRKSKVESISSAMATAYFNQIFLELFKGTKHEDKLAIFDSRAFSVPREDVVNIIYWRQQDCTRNSVQMVGQANFSHKQLQNKSCNDIQEMLFQEKGINWNDLPTYQKRGTAVYKRRVDIGPKYGDTPIKDIGRTEVYIDKDIPIFSKDRDFIQKWVDIDKEDPLEKSII